MLEYLFCPRFIYFENYLGIPQNQEKRFKVLKGRDVHLKIKKLNFRYLRKKLSVVDKKEQDIIINCKYPKPTAVKRRCPDCCYRNLCEKNI